MIDLINAIFVETLLSMFDTGCHPVPTLEETKQATLQFVCTNFHQWELQSQLKSDQFTHSLPHSRFCLVTQRLRWLKTVLAVCDYVSFAKSWQEKGCSSQAEIWQMKTILMKHFD